MFLRTFVGSIAVMKWWFSKRWNNYFKDVLQSDQPKTNTTCSYSFRVSIEIRNLLKTNYLILFSLLYLLSKKKEALRREKRVFAFRAPGPEISLENPFPESRGSFPS